MSPRLPAWKRRNLAGMPAAAMDDAPDFGRLPRWVHRQFGLLLGKPEVLQTELQGPNVPFLMRRRPRAI